MLYVYVCCLRSGVHYSNKTTIRRAQGRFVFRRLGKVSVGKFSEKSKRETAVVARASGMMTI